MNSDDLGVAAHENYAFLNHSATTLYHNLPPSVDDKPLARQKRKRTSPEDQAILETAYKRDPKPDKAARLELVKCVALGEKEVQIWFQNRRQSSRRKSRPLLPHEIASYQLARSEALEHGLEMDSSPRIESEIVDSVTRDSPEVPMLPPRQGSPTLQPSKPLPRSIDILSSDGASQPPAAQGRSDINRSHVVTSRSHVPLSRDSPEIVVDQLTVRHGMLPTDGLRTTRDPSGRQNLFESVPRLPLKKTSSLVRLSMTADGNAQITTKDASSPSPPRPSQSSVGSDAVLPIPAPRGIQRTASGRSRDSRSWEFWCDKESRSELESKAEKDASGSATGAIGLLRSASGRSILGPLASKRNALFAGPAPFAKRPKLAAGVPSLHRSSTSLGRLQGKAHRSNTVSQPQLKHSKSTTSLSIPGNESDKENWSPDREEEVENKTHVGMGGRDAAAFRKSDGVSPRQRAKTWSSLNRQTVPTRADAPGLPGCEDDPEDDAELAAFMHADRQSASPSEDDDLDCVQGLLSLSQGNWR